MEDQVEVPVMKAPEPMKVYPREGSSAEVTAKNAVEIPLDRIPQATKDRISDIEGILGSLEGKIHREDLSTGYAGYIRKDVEDSYRAGKEFSIVQQNAGFDTHNEREVSQANLFFETFGATYSASDGIKEDFHADSGSILNMMRDIRQNRSEKGVADVTNGNIQGGDLIFDQRGILEGFVLDTKMEGVKIIVRGDAFLNVDESVRPFDRGKGDLRPSLVVKTGAAETLTK